MPATRIPKVDDFEASLPTRVGALKPGDTLAQSRARVASTAPLGDRLLVRLVLADGSRRTYRWRASAIVYVVQP